MKTYKVISLQNTVKYEKDFDIQYHEKYIGKIGEEVKHHCKPGIWAEFVFLVFEKDDKGRSMDGDWFHKDDLEKMEE